MRHRGIVVAALLFALPLRADEARRQELRDLLAKNRGQVTEDVARTFRIAGDEGLAVAIELTKSGVLSRNWAPVLLRVFTGPRANAALLACAAPRFREPADACTLVVHERRVGGARAEAALEELLAGARGDRADQLRTEVFWFATEAQVGGLENLASRGGDSRRIALSALARMGGGAASEAIARAVGDARDEDAVAALSASGNAAAVPAILRDFPGELATEFTCGNSIGAVREYSKALEQLVTIGAPALPALREMAAEGRPDQRLYALFALSALESPENLPTLRAALRDRDPRVRDLAASMLERRGDAQDAPLVRPLLQDASPAVRLTAASTLASWGDVTAVPALIDAIRSPPAEPVRPPLHWRADPHQALRTLTGADPTAARRMAAPVSLGGAPTDAERAGIAADWQAWWEAHRAELESRARGH